MTRPPSWIKIRVPTPAQSKGLSQVRDVLRRFELETVCQGAQCPNAAECWSAGTATFMVLGSTCTRHCRFCDVPTGDPEGRMDVDEPARLAAAIRELALDYVVLTSVDRDDLPDGGADAIGQVIEAIARETSATSIEVLLPDFGGSEASLDRILRTPASVLGHNVETVRRLSPQLRDVRAGYDRSLGVLQYLSGRAGERPIKSGLMLGLGETTDEIGRTLQDLRAAGVSVITLGQYLAPSATAIPVVRYLEPSEFDALADRARSLGFRSVVAGPLVRSSYHAATAYHAS